MNMYYRRLIIVLATIIFCYSCDSKKPPHKPHLKETIDKEAWQACDSLVEHNIFGADSAMTHKVLQNQLKRFPDWKDSATHAWLLVNIGEAYGYTGQLDSVEKYSREALTYYENHPEYPLPLNMCYSGIGFSMLHLNDDIYKANYYCTKAASLCLLPGSDTIFPLDLSIRSLSSAASSNSICHFYQQALRFSREAYKKSFAVKTTWPGSYLFALVDMARGYLNVNQYDSAFIYLKKAKGWNDTLKNEEYGMSVKYGFATYYYYTKQYDSSLHYSLELSAVDTKNNVFGGLYNNALLYCLLDRKDEAKKCLDMAAKLFDSVKSDAERKGFTSVRTLFQIKYGDRNEAAKSFIEYDQLIVDFYNEERAKILASIESEYNLVDKQKNLDKLSGINKKAKEELQAKNNLLITTILVILLCAVVIVVLLLIFRQRKLKATTQAAAAQRDKIALEQRLLRTQMEPHFIFNTMAAMQYFINKNENEKASIYLNRFARLLRTSLEHSREDYVLVSEEIETLENYISLQAMQSGNGFDYTIQAYERFKEDDIKIPPMLLQPFVENAILHGINDVQHKGHILIVIEKKERVLDCTITDNGSGIKHTGTAGRKSLSMQITQERLEALSKETGEKAKLEVVDRNNSDETGTTVHMVIPFI
jgi:tetratricopeptide (TPR) repeat protein